MRYFSLTAIFLLALFTTTYAQQPSRKLETTSFNPVVDSVAEALVALAMNNAEVSVLENQAMASKYTYKKSKTVWLNNINAIGNLNEFSIKQSSGSDPALQSTQFPRYNFGVTVPLGIFINNRKQTKSDYFQYQASLDQITIEKQNLRLAVLTYYQDYLMNVKLNELQQQVVHDYEIIYQKNEEKFKNNSISLDALNNSSMLYHNELAKQISYEHAVKVTEANLEALIGMSLRVALDQINATSGQQ